MIDFARITVDIGPNYLPGPYSRTELEALDRELLNLCFPKRVARASPIQQSTTEFEHFDRGTR